jgi:hypothetical protein
MAIYRAIYRPNNGPNISDRWLIERTAFGAVPVRLPFKGTRQQAYVEADRLNAHPQKGAGVVPV